MTVTRSGGGFDRLTVALKDLDGVKGKVGWFETSRYLDGTPVAVVAAAHEFGAGVPMRPFFRPAIAANSDKWMTQIGQGAARVLSGDTTARHVLELVTLGAAEDVIKSLKAIPGPPLDPRTIARKGFDTILRDTGQLFQDLTATVENE